MKELVLILLAAGSSKRFHGNKLLHLLQGKPMYQHMADQIDRLPADVFAQKLVVTQYEEIMKDLGGRGYRIIENHESQRGISCSIRLALNAVENGEASLCFAVCDQPYLKAETLKRLVDGWRRSGKGLGCLSYHGEPGNPVIFSACYQKELLALEGDVGGRKVLRHHPDDIFFYEAKDGKELTDMDTRFNTV